MSLCLSTSKNVLCVHLQGLVSLQEVSDSNQPRSMILHNLSEMVSCGECNSTDIDIEGNFCNECGEELQEETEEEERLIVVGLIREVFKPTFTGR